MSSCQRRQQDPILPHVFAYSTDLQIMPVLKIIRHWYITLSCYQGGRAEDIVFSYLQIPTKSDMRPIKEVSKIWNNTIPMTRYTLCFHNHYNLFSYFTIFSLIIYWLTYSTYCLEGSILQKANYIEERIVGENVGLAWQPAYVTHDIQF